MGICQQPGLSQLLMSSPGPIPQCLFLPTFPCVDYISRGITGGLHSRPPGGKALSVLLLLLRCSLPVLLLLLLLLLPGAC